MKERIHLFILSKCGFADILPVDTYIDPPPYATDRDNNGDGAGHTVNDDEDRRRYANLLDKWIVIEWAAIQAKVRPRQPPFTLEEEHCRHIRRQLSRFRFDLREAIAPLLPLYYGLKKSGYHENNIERVKQLLPDIFHNPEPESDKYLFHHPILLDVLGATCFNRQSKGLAVKYPKEFKLIPLATIALICAITRHLIVEYATGEHCSINLHAEEQAPYYQMYLDALLDIRKPGHHPPRIRKLQKTLFLECYKPKVAPRAPETIACAEREWGDDSADSEPEGYGDVMLPPDTPTDVSPSPPQSLSPTPGAPPTPASARHPVSHALSVPQSSPPVAGPSHHAYARRSSSMLPEQHQATKGAELDEPDDDYDELAREDRDVYYGGAEETLKDD